MRSSQNSAQNDIDISTLPAALKRRTGAIAIAAAAVGLVTYGALMMVPPRYASEAQIRIGGAGLGDGGRGQAGSAESAALRVDREAIASRVHELRSPDLARKLATELKLNLRPEFNSALDGRGFIGTALRLAGLAGPRPGETEEERVLAAYYKALQVYQVKDTRVITLGFTARDGDLAARAANRLIELYEEWLRQQGVTETADANAWLVPEIESRTRELGKAEAEAERFRSTANLFRGSGAGRDAAGLAEQQLSDLSSELTKVRAQRGEADARARAARELMARNQPDSIPDVQKSPVIQGLIAQRVKAERDLAEAATQLLPAHPRMKQLNANVLDMRRQVQREAGAIVDGLEREVKAMALREELASRTLDEAKSRMGNKAADRVRLSQLEDEVKAKRRELEMLRERYEASRSRGTTKAVPVEVQVIATALPSSRPSWPHPVPMAALAAAATFVLGLVGVLMRELMAGGAQARRRMPTATEPAFEARPAAARSPAPSTPPGRPAPSPALAAARAGAPAMPPAQSRMDDAIPVRLAGVDAVVRRLVGNSAGQNGYRTLVVGEAGGMDVREEATDIAAGLAAAGRQVVLVDWSPDGRGMAEALGIAPSPGFSELLAGTASFEDVIRSLPDGDVHVLPGGGPLLGGVESLQPDRLNLLLDALDEAYADIVITGSHAAVRDFFRLIEGRIDAGVVVAGQRVSDGEEPGRLLGFEVTEIDVIRLDAGRAPAMPIARNVRGQRTGTGLSVASAPSG
ncbi:MAG: GumC family protein [Hyphomicrobiaceae bacterium]